MSRDSVYVEGRGIIPVVGYKKNEEGRKVCGGCGSSNTQLENHSGMWGDGDVVCLDCGGYVRMWDSG